MTLLSGATLAQNGLDNRYAPASNTYQATQVSTSTNLTSRVLATTQPPAFAPVSSIGPNDILVDPSKTFQSFLGCGAALTDAAAYCFMSYLTATQRHALLTEMFSPSQGNLSAVRISFGSTDFQQSSPYTYDEVPTGQTDAGMINFTVQQDTVRLIPLLREILAINPGVKVIASVWHPPSWMLTVPADNFTTTNVVIASQWLTTYAAYLVKCVQAYESFGIPIYGVCYANECEPGNKFGMAVADQQTVIKTFGAGLENAGLAATKIISHDAQWDSITTTATAVLADAATAAYLDGVAFHGYSGIPSSSQNTLRRAYPGLNVYNTEWRSLAAESADTVMRGMAGGWVVETIENFSSMVLCWNMALDQAGNPTTTSPGRRGFVTIPNTSTGVVVRNQEFYALTHLSRFVKPGAKRCAVLGPSRGPRYNAYITYPSTLKTTAFTNPDGSIVVYAYNGAGTSQTFQIIDGRTNKGFAATVAAGDVATFVWGLPSQSSIAGTTPPGAPAAVTPTVTPTPGTATITWAAPSTGAPVTGYSIYRGTTLIGMAPSTATSYVDLVGAGTYTYQVAFDSTAGTVTSSGVNGTIVAATASGAPVVTASSNTAGAGLVLTWTAPAANGAPVTSYSVNRSTTTGTETSIATAYQGILTYTDTSAVGGTAYFYTVTATNSVGSTTSAEITATRQGAFIDVVATGTVATNAASATWSHNATSGLANTLVVVALGGSGVDGTNNNPTFSGVTYGGVAMTSLSRVAGNPGSSANRVIDLWYLVAPTAGAKTIVATLNGSAGSVVSNIFPASISFGGVNQSTPFGTPVTAASANTAAQSVTTAGVAKDLVLAAMSARTTQVPPGTGAGQITQWELNKNDNTQVMATIQTSGSSVVSSFSWATASTGAMVAVPVKGA